MKSLFLFSFLAACIFTSCNSLDKKHGAKVATAAGNDLTQKELVIDLAAIIEQKGENGLVDVFIARDEYFARPKNYLGYALRPILDSVVKANHFDTTGMLVVFKCRDGYSPGMDISKAFGDKNGYIVVKDKEATGDNKWIDSLAARFAPFYLVWQNEAVADHSFPWPFGLTKVSLMPTMFEYKTIYPFSNPGMVEGFTLFRNNCNKCHALNHVGGVMGPEMNVPKNITEYWKKEDILNFAMDPKSYRSSSQMPPMKGLLTVEEIKSIIGYLEFVSKQKVTN